MLTQESVNKVFSELQENYNAISTPKDGIKPFNKFKEDILQSLNFDLSKKSICIKPRIIYDVIIDTTKHMPNEGASKIMEFSQRRMESDVS
ncbi:MAG: hypothetical protein ABIA74_04955 [bacterium]